MDAPPVAASSPDLDAFHEDLDILAVRIPKNQCAVALKQLSEVRLNREKVKSIVTNPAHSEERLLLLDEKYKDISYLPEELLSRIHALGGEVVRHNLRLDVSHFTYDQLLRKLLPAGVEVPTAFETVGHIARLTLRPAQLPYKHIIGKAILKTIPQLRTVVNKTKNIETQFRTSQLEVIAGENDLETSVKESNCVFRLNFAEVYWNSRLGTEHARLVSLFYPNQLICDMFAGVGPFAIPAAKKGCLVYANDLNPRSHHYLRVNADLNKVSSRVVTCMTSVDMDARQFVRQAAREAPRAFHHIVMNLPASSIEFLERPIVHCYAFARGGKGGEGERELLARAEGVLGCPLGPAVRVFQVRDVSPRKLMFCLSFPLPDIPSPVHEVAAAPLPAESASSSPPAPDSAKRKEVAAAPPAAVSTAPSVPSPSKRPRTNQSLA